MFSFLLKALQSFGDLKDVVGTPYVFPPRIPDRKIYVHWDRVSPGTPIRHIRSGHTQQGVFKNSKAFELNGVDLPSLHEFAKAHNEYLLAEGIRVKAGTDAWYSVEFQIEDGSWAKFDAIRSRD